MEAPLPVIKELRDPYPDLDKKFLLGAGQYTALRVVHDTESLLASATKLANDTEAIPQPSALGRLLRAEGGTERSLNQAIDRLERLQRRRRGEEAPLPVSVRLAR